MITNKTFEELSEDEIRYVLSLRCVDVKDYLLKIHGKTCFDGFIKRFVNCRTQNLTPAKVTAQNEAFQQYLTSRSAGF
ncbi:hypothetical protein [Nitrosopumilus sp.]|uniref:hypothetical protein n=1 Tax=Nitrosopumilus sp. TaxID=2024843 RepID=UPI0034A0A71E